jgi:glycosyltransferase involved in cell wall biosynthesis
MAATEGRTVHLIGLVESPDHVCCRYRLRAFREQLAADGHALEIKSLPRRWWDRLRIMPMLGRADAVILQRKLLPSWQTTILRRCVRRLIFDFDDAVFMRDSYAARGPDSPRRRRRFAAVVGCADAIVAGNDWLADQAWQARATGVVRVIPSCVEPTNYPQARHASADGVTRLTWVGSSSTLNGLEQTRELFDALAAIPNVCLKVISNRFPAFGRMTVEPCPWSSDTEAAEIAAGDIGVSCVPDDDWSRGKCGLKILQYMAAGLPVVANPVGVHATLIRHGETGFLATTPSDWIGAVRRLAQDPDLRRRMGSLGRLRIQGEYSVAAGARRWHDLLEHPAITVRAAG